MINWKKKFSILFLIFGNLFGFNVFSQEKNANTGEEIKKVIEYNAKISVYAKVCLYSDQDIEKFDNHLFNNFSNWKPEEITNLKSYYIDLKFKLLQANPKINCDIFKEEFNKIKNTL